MDSSRKKKLIAFGVISLVLAVLLSLLEASSLLSRIENILWTFRLQYIANPQEADQKIKIIIIDQASLDHFAREEKLTWPWPRPLYVPVLEFLKRGGAKAVAFDLIFSESSAQGVEDDREFAESIGNSLPVVSAAALENSSHDRELEGWEEFRSKQLPVAQAGNLAARYLAGTGARAYNSATLPIPEIISASAAIASVNATPDLDGVFRHYRPGAFLRDVPLLGLPFALYEAGSGGERLLTSDIREFMDESGELTVRFHGPTGTYPTYEIANIISSYVALEEGAEPRYRPEEFKDSLVFVGVWAPGLLDLRPTPLDRVYRGVEYNATVLDNLIHGDFVVKLSRGWVVAIGVLLALAVSACTLFMRGLSLQLGLPFVLLFLYVLSCFWAADAGVWINMAGTLLSCNLAVISGFVFQYQLEGRQRRYLRQAFAHYVSPAVIDQVVRDPSSLALGGEKRELSLFFSDIAGFTSISEKLEASQLLKLLNEYLSEMSSLILVSGGTLDKYVGDAIVAFWNAPVSVPDHAFLAVETALKCQKALSELAPKFEAEYGVKLKQRIGINTGVVNVGNFGSHDHFNYTVIGDAANLAARLEGLNKNFGTGILISQSTHAALQERVICRKVGEVRVVGRQQSVVVFEPLAVAGDGFDQSFIRDFETCYSMFEQGQIKQALEKFRAIEHDPVARAYIERIEEELQSGAVTPNWSPVWNMTTK